VDDIIFGSTDIMLCKQFEDLMKSEFEMSMMGELRFFLGLQIKQQKEGILIHQTKYCKELIKKFGMSEAKSISTPMHPMQTLDADLEGEKVSETTYRGMIGSLLYLTASIPDIKISVGICARFQSNPKLSHMTAVKRILRYLIGTTNLGLWYEKGISKSIVGYIDADYAGDRLERKRRVDIVASLAKA